MSIFGAFGRAGAHFLLGTLILLGCASGVWAQSSAGSIYGTIQAGQGTSVSVSNEATGFSRELSVSADGTFNFPALPTGTYKVTLKNNGSTVAERMARVNAGVGTSVSFGGEIEEIVVSGTAASPIDLTTSQISTTFSADQLQALPVAKDIIDVALLAPGTVKGDALLGVDGQYGHLASFGGSSVAENSYYINGFNVTNLFKNLAYSELPFYAIDSQQVITGGYGPEFGMSTGGVVNLTTKRGTNDWHVGAAITSSPDSLRTDNPRTYTPNGEAYRDYSKNEDSTIKYDVWGGGPLVSDKLFMYAIVESTEQKSLIYPRSYEARYNVKDRKLDEPFGLFDLTWNVNDSNILDFTFLHDRREYKTVQYSDDYDANGFVVKGPLAGTDYLNEGGDTMFVKYTGYLTDKLTLTAQYGTLDSSRENYQRAPDGSLIAYDGTVGNFNQPGCPLVVYEGGWQAQNPGAPLGACYVSTTIGTQAAKDKRTAGRVDFEYALPKHTVGFGVDMDKWSSFDGESYVGGSYYRYQYNTTLGVNQVRVRHFQTGADAEVDSDAFYLKDDYQITPNFLLQLGVRSDSFKNLNGDKVAYVKQDNILQPRVGFAWDMRGDSKSKLFGSYGLYSLPIAATVAVRGASASIFTQQYFTYTAIDPTTGTPTLGAPLTSLLYLNHEDGTTPDPGAVSSRGLDPTIQEEFNFGFQTQLKNDWKAGIRATFRNLKKTIDDICDLRPFEQWANDNGYGATYDDSNIPGCLIFNPGYAMDVNVDVNGDGIPENVHLTPDMIKSPKARRKYVSLEFSLEKLFNEKWYTQMSYVWAHNKGNAEGLVKSDIGQDDTGVTQDFDFYELMIGSYGDLPNDRRHTLKFLGTYTPVQQLSLSASALIQSGRPINCFGVNPADVNFGYGASYFACNGVVVPRGSVGTTATVTNINAGITWQPRGAKGLSLQAKVFNVFDRHGGLSVDETGENDNGDGTGSPRTGYRSISSYQTPRYLEFNLTYQF